MRLPWPFGRRTPSDGPSSDSGGGPGGEAADAPVAQRVAADAPPTGAWAALPPIQRTIGAPPLVAPTAPFLDAVPGHHPLPSIVQPLGHEVTPTAPAGLVAAHVAPIPSLTSHAAMPTRHVQRRAAGPAAAPVDAWSETDASAAAPAAPVEASAPIRHVAPVAASQTVTPAVRPLTEAPAVAPARSPVAQRSAAPSAASSAGSPAPGWPATASSPELPLAARGTPPARAGGRWSETPTAPVAGLGAPIAGASSGAGSPSTPSLSTSATASSSTPAVQRSAGSGSAPTSSTGGEPGRRAGLGAPMSSLPPTAAQPALPGMPLVQRSVSAEAIARALGAAGSGSVPAGPVEIPLLAAGAPAGAAASAQDPHAGHDHASAGVPSAAGTPGSPVQGRPLPVLPVARQRAASAPAAVQRSATPGSSAGAPASPGARPGATPAPAILPLLGARPLRPSVVLQRQEDGSAEPGEPDLPVVARWASGEALPDAGHTSGPGAAVPLQRLAAASESTPMAPATAQPEASPAPVREMLFATAGWSPAGLPPGVQVTTQAAAAAMPVAPAVQRAVPARDRQSLQLARPASTPTVTAPTPSDRRVEAGTAASPAPVPTIQTSPAAVAAPMLTATPIVQRVEGAAPPVQEGGGAGQSDTELDELSRKLFGRIRGQLRAELTQEREARGLSFDAF